MTFSFNLIDQPWIPCLRLDGTFAEFSLRDMLASAHELREICCETPIMTAALFPMTLALLHRVFGPPNRDAWEDLWQQGMFPLAALDAYFAQWYDRFDLFHPERPFYQAKDERVEPKSIIHLIHAVGNTGTVFTHVSDESSLLISPITAAQHLLTAQVFRTAGLSGLDEKFTDSTFARGVLFWADGATIFETMMLSLIRYPSEITTIPITSNDLPTWEQNEPFRKRAHPYGYLDYLTWQSNRVWLLPEDQGGGVFVEKMTVGPGLRMSADVISPQKRYSKKQSKDGVESWSFLYFNEAKALWRDYHSLVTPVGPDVIPPAVVTWLAQLAEYDLVPRNATLQIMAIGMLADQAKLIFYRQEKMPLPLALLGDDETRSRSRTLIAQAVAAADTVAERLRMAVNELAENVLMRGSDRKPDGGDIKDLVQQWDVIALYWSQLEAPFWELIGNLGQGKEDVLTDWHTILFDTAMTSLHAAARMSGTSAPALKGQVMAERKLRSMLRKALNIQEPR